MVRYDEIVNIIELFTQNHHYFKGFGHGSIDKIDAAVNRGYPLLFMRPMSSPGLTVFACCCVAMDSHSLCTRAPFRPSCHPSRSRFMKVKTRIAGA